MVLVLQAQELTVKSMEVAEGDLTASVHPRNDLNGNPCALVRVMLKDSAPKFEGNVLGEVERVGVQHMVYMSAGSKQLEVIYGDNHLQIFFSDYGIEELESKVTYNVVIVTQGNRMSYDGMKNVETYVVNGVKFKMVRVDGGTFMMGATAEQFPDDENADKPVHQVTLSTYYIGETEVTQELWKAVMGKNPAHYFDLKKNMPVECVSWDDCQTFVRKLSVLTGLPFRLPTEAEWEYAARGAAKGHGYAYAGSENLDEVAWYYFNSYAMGVDSPDYGTHVVGSMRGNELGLYDMSGNVSEWCADWYGSYPEEAQTDPVGPETGLRRVTRGGGWFSIATDCRTTIRNYEAPGSRNYSLGFRLAL